MSSYKRAVELAGQMAPAEQIPFAVKCADAVFAPKYRGTTSYLVHWQNFLAAPFDGERADTIMNAFPCNDRSEEYIAAQSAGAAAWRLQRGNVEHARGLAERSLWYAMSADEAGSLLDLDALAEDVRSRSVAP